MSELPEVCKTGSCNASVELVVENFGELIVNGVKNSVKRFTWVSSTKTEIQVINYGGCITSIKLPDIAGKVDDVVIGFNKFEDYLKADNQYFGCTVGRVANRIAKGKMTIDGNQYTLAVNNDCNHLHGGIKGFDKVIWDYSIRENELTLSYVSPDMEEGYPGTLLVNVTFELTKFDEFIINYKAMTSKPTVINLTNHSYFNLAGDHTEAEEIYKHEVYINANRIIEIDDNLIPTGRLLEVKDTVFDFTKAKVLGDVINKVPDSPGFDHNFCVNNCAVQRCLVARVSHPSSGRIMEVYSDQPGVQFYTGNFLPESQNVKGKNGFITKHGAFCLETQNYPDAVNQPKFPSTLLYPGEIYHTTTMFKFFIGYNE